jgi:catechol-2,3-dioxygenase
MIVDTNGHGPTVKVKSPKTLAHVVFRTGNYRAMVDFYRDFLGAEITHENGSLAFLRYDEEHHRVAIIAVPGTGPRERTAAGLEHVAFSYDSLSDLTLAYRQRKSLGIMPQWCTNHGPTTSMYYSDPDGNKIEMQVDNFDTAEEANDFMASKYFAENPIGTDFDPEDLVKKIEAGESHAAIKKRIEIGPRGLPDF